jgi:hypothetical protein
MPVIGCFVIFLLNSLQALKAWEVAIRKIQAKDKCQRSPALTAKNL